MDEDETKVDDEVFKDVLLVMVGLVSCKVVDCFWGLQRSPAPLSRNQGGNGRLVVVMNLGEHA